MESFCLLILIYYLCNVNSIIENNINFDHIMVLGDTHGSNMTIFPTLMAKFGFDKGNQKIALLHVGDVGVGFTTDHGQMLELQHLNERLKKGGITLFCIRGNHDNPEWFNNQEFKTDNGVDGLTNIVLIPDHTKLVLEVNGEIKTIYCNGGAYSVDRTLRTPGKSYWYDEHFKVPTTEELSKIGDGIDIVLTHTRPIGVWPIDKTNIEYWLLKDMALDRDIEEEGFHMKRLIDSIKEDNPECLHLYGHFHKSNVEYHNGWKHQCLDINELIEIR